MEQREPIKSPFQMRDWRIVHLNYNNLIFALNQESEVKWKIEVSKKTEYTEGQDYYTGAIRLEFTATIPQENLEMILTGEMVSLFTYDGEQNDDNDQKLDQLLKINGLTYCLGMLRNFLSSLSDLLGIRKRLIFPSINLYSIRFDEEIILS